MADDQAKLNASLINNIGLQLARCGGEALYTAIAMLRRARALNPEDRGPRINLASLLVMFGEDEEAESLASAILRDDQAVPIAWQVLGFLATNRGHLGQAIDYFKRAHEIDPAHGQYCFDLASAYLRAGDWDKGLPLYERRNEILPATGKPPPGAEWKGEKTKHLAVWPDQGYGDGIMFSRFLPWAKERADKITLMVTPETLPLYNGFSEICEVLSVYPHDAPFEHQIRLSSLPLLYGARPDNVPPDSGLVSKSASVGSIGNADKLKIGIAWQGNKLFPGDFMRSIPFREFLPLASDPRNVIYSLQCGPASGDIAIARAQRVVEDMSGKIEGEWTHTAALMRHFDLIVSSCTAIPHLAGAMGIPTFVMIPQFADWRWLHGREDTVWYPNTRLFRQTRVGQWKDVMANVLKAIDQIHVRRGIVAALNRQNIPAISGGVTIDGQYEPEVRAVMRRVLRPGDCFVDVGANEGKHTLFGADLVGKDGHVLAFEPGQARGQLLKAAEGRTEIEVMVHPVWHKPEPVEFHFCADGSGGDALWDPGRHAANEKSREKHESVTLHATTLDEQLSLRGWKPRLIKIDTEGAELHVLQGAVELLLSDDRPPFIVAELHEGGLNALGGSQKAMREFMAEAGYETFILSAHDDKPTHVKRQDRIKSEYIVNILFATEADVDAAWREEIKVAA